MKDQQPNEVSSSSFRWTRITDQFESEFKKTFVSDKKAHFDNLPDEYRTVDGAKTTWCNLLLIDALIYILKNDQFNSSLRRAFNQHVVLYECILVELKSIHSDTFTEISADKRVAAVRHNSNLSSSNSEQRVQQADKYSHLTLQELEYPWNSMENLRFSLIKGCPPSKAKHKYMAIVEMLCNHDSVTKYAHDLNVVIQLVISKALFVFNNHKVSLMSDQLASFHIASSGNHKGLYGTSPRFALSSSNKFSEGRSSNNSSIGGGIVKVVGANEVDGAIEIVTLQEQQRAQQRISGVAMELDATPSATTSAVARKAKRQMLESVGGSSKKLIVQDLQTSSSQQHSFRIGANMDNISTQSLISGPPLLLRAASEPWANHHYSGMSSSQSHNSLHLMANSMLISTEVANNNGMQSPSDEHTQALMSLKTTAVRSPSASNSRPPPTPSGKQASEDSVHDYELLMFLRNDSSGSIADNNISDSSKPVSSAEEERQQLARSLSGLADTARPVIAGVGKLSVGAPADINALPFPVIGLTHSSGAHSGSISSTGK